MGWPYPMAVMFWPWHFWWHLVMVTRGPWLSRAFDYLLSSDAAVQQKARAGRHWKALEVRDALLRSDRCCRNSDRRLKTNLTIPHWPQPQLGTAMGVVVVRGIQRSLPWWRRCERLESERRQEVSSNTGAGRSNTKLLELEMKLIWGTPQRRDPWFQNSNISKTNRIRSFIIFARNQETGRQRATFCAWSVEPIFSGVLPVLIG